MFRFLRTNQITNLEPPELPGQIRKFDLRHPWVGTAYDESFKIQSSLALSNAEQDRAPTLNTDQLNPPPID